ncbi:hypothetical protein CLAIMM_10061 [Cladophialophora immunda]|nr:hypothetical protein CLAIMM_10061 [Cladophialophora immunda]
MPRSGSAARTSPPPDETVVFLSASGHHQVTSGAPIALHARHVILCRQRGLPLNLNVMSQVGIRHPQPLDDPAAFRESFPVKLAL